MSKVKYIGLDVHQVSISAAVLEESGKVMLQCTMPTQSLGAAWANDKFSGWFDFASRPSPAQGVRASLTMT